MDGTNPMNWVSVTTQDCHNSFLHTFPLGTSLSPRLLLLLRLGLGFLLGLGFRKSQSPELQGLCSYKSHPKGNARLPPNGFLHTFPLGTSLSPRLLLLLCPGLGFLLGSGFRKAQSPELQGLSSYKSHDRENTRLPWHCSLSTFLLGISFQKPKAGFTARPRIGVMPRIRLQKTTKPRVPQIQQLQKVYRGNTELPQHDSSVFLFELGSIR